MWMLGRVAPRVIREPIDPLLGGVTPAIEDVALSASGLTARRVSLELQWAKKCPDDCGVRMVKPQFRFREAFFGFSVVQDRRGALVGTAEHAQTGQRLIMEARQNDRLRSEATHDFVSQRKEVRA